MITRCSFTFATVLLGLNAAASHAAADHETVYQRTQADGGISLTNVPDDSHGYQVMPIGTPATASSEGPSAVTSAAGNVERVPDLAVPRLAQTPPSIEARRGKLLDSDSAPSSAAAQARQSQEEIAAAGGARERLIRLYQASRSAFQDKRPAQNLQH